MYGATYVLSSGGMLDATTGPYGLRVERPLFERSTARTGSRLAAARAVTTRVTGSGGQPLGSTMTVTSGVIPVKTLIATL